MPAGRTRDGLVRAEQLGLSFDVQRAGEEPGTGPNVSSQDTVPFAVWVAARHLDSYADALGTAAAHPGLELASSALAIFAVGRDTRWCDRRRHRGLCDRGRRDSDPWREASARLPI